MPGPKLKNENLRVILKLTEKKVMRSFQFCCQTRLTWGGEEEGTVVGELISSLQVTQLNVSLFFLQLNLLTGRDGLAPPVQREAPGSDRGVGVEQDFHLGPGRGVAQPQHILRLEESLYWANIMTD